jgi:hypothetical protein
MLGAGMQRNLVPDTVVRRFVRGSATEPKEALLAWLAAQSSDRRLRLPVVLGRGAVGFSLRAARVGGGPDPLMINIDDAALGVGLAERARQACGDAAMCAMWVEGSWRGGEDRVFTAVKAGATIEREALAQAAAEVEEA